MDFFINLLIAVLVFLITVKSVSNETLIGYESIRTIEQCEQSIPRDQSCKLIAVVDDTFSSK